jgi:hypothetical protein
LSENHPNCLKIIQNYTHPLHPARRCDRHDHLRLPTHLRGHPRDLIAIARTTGQFDLAGPDFCSNTVQLSMSFGSNNS